MIDVSNIFFPLPNPLQYKAREPDFSCFPPLQGGTKGGNNAIKITANHFSNNLLARGYKPLAADGSGTISQFKFDLIPSQPGLFAKTS
ncbi:hypothetical protein NIES4072_04840 [Nostoc commune NIES-4072]|uniref:Uncharacterized protein n=1 Tax=Nostoc commune NIES-4072 TaxID=2005467 RepID=A0A2R5FHM2_NOSCO|nr:hypothetical protein NIES4070_21980 [Nostoc commune HK-02]GBG16838.1 hypothetical protein NIES4072_04840 [Nostoc commune NIES-4072]